MDQHPTTRGLTSPFFLSIGEYLALARKILKSLNLSPTVDRVEDATYHVMRADWKWDARLGVPKDWWRRYLVEQAVLKNKKKNVEKRPKPLHDEMIDKRSGNDLSILFYRELVGLIINPTQRKCVDDWTVGVPTAETAKELGVTMQTVYNNRKKGIQYLRERSHVFS